jgi:hypothetical protein
MEHTPITLLCASVPAGWLHPDGTPLDAIRQPCTIDGLRLTRIDDTELAWARSPKWVLVEELSTVVSSAFKPAVPEPWQYLMEKGWDLAWLDRIQELQADSIKPLSPKEIEPFFALMQLAKNSPLVKKLGTEKSVTDLIEALRQKKPKDRPAMERVAMNMRVVRVSRVQVDDPGQAAILGSNHYYQLDAMADIGNRTYEIKGEKEPVVYHNEYPVTCVSIDVPSWLKPNLPSLEKDTGSTQDQVWYPRMKTTASGWFYRFWSYKTQETSQSLGAQQRQIGPLVVMDSLSLGFSNISETAPVNTNAITSNAITLVIGVLGTIGIWWFVRRAMRKPPRGNRR